MWVCIIGFNGLVDCFRADHSKDNQEYFSNGRDVDNCPVRYKTVE